MSSPTQRTLHHLRTVDGNGAITAVQATSDNGGNVAKRVAKIAESDAIPYLRKANIRVLAHGWRKRKGRYVLREVDLS